MATSFTLPLVLRAWLAAPVPRPPQPISAILISSSPAAWALRPIDRLPASAPDDRRRRTFQEAAPRGRRVAGRGRVSWSMSPRGMGRKLAFVKC